MPVKLEQKQLLDFAKKMDGKLLSTTARKTQFHVNVSEDSLVFTPVSSGKSRREPVNNLDKVIDHFNTSNSMIPKDYHDVTFNSVYILKVIDLYRKHLLDEFK
jgi:hypothetical protein